MRININRIPCFTRIAALMVFIAAPLSGSDFHHSLRGRSAAIFAHAPRTEAADQANPGEGKILYYQDPMHPWYRSDKPGIAPDCGMKLVPVYASEVAAGALPPGGIQISPTRQQLIGVTSAPAEYRTIDQVVRTTGQVAVDESRISTVSTRVSGWVRKVYVNSTFQHVDVGEPLFTVYSPDLLAAEQEFLLALKARKILALSSLVDVNADGTSLLDAARTKLSLLDIAPDQILALEETGKPQQETTIYSPAQGHVLERKVLPNQYITPESELYRIVDHRSMWILAEIYEPDIPYVSENQEAVVTAEAIPGKTFMGRVTFIEPHLMEETRTERVRMEFPNADLKLEPGMFVGVELHRGFGRRLTVPVDAVLVSARINAYSSIAARVSLNRAP